MQITALDSQSDLSQVSPNVKTPSVFIDLHTAIEAVLVLRYIAEKYVAKVPF